MIHHKHLQAIDTIIWKHLRWEINSGIITLTQNSKAIYAKINNNHRAQVAIENVIKKLPKTIGSCVSITGEYIFAPIETVEQKVDFAEVKASAIGQVLVEHKNETLRLMEQFADSLKELRDIKKEYNLL